MRGAPVSKASAIILKEWKKVKASDKKMKKYKGLTKKRNNGIKKPCRSTKKIIWMKWK